MRDRRIVDIPIWKVKELLARSRELGHQEPELEERIAEMEELNEK